MLLAGWLRRELRFSGAAGFVERHGVAVVVAALREDVGLYYDDAPHGGRAGWKPRPHWRNPGGALRWVLEGGR